VPAREHWPATRAGTLASGWLGAFAAGEDSMRAFLTRDMAESSLKSRGVAARLARYREMREEYGRFQLERVVDSKPSALKAKLLDGQARSWEAEFTLEDAAPWKLRSVTLRGLAGGGHGVFGGFHH
jgi:hypothetical protein